MKIYNLTTKGKFPEIISTTKANNLEEAKYVFSTKKRLSEEELLGLFYVVKRNKTDF